MKTDIYTDDKVIISASVSCMDLGALRESMQETEQSDVSFYHFDVVDGRFNECFILGETTLRAMKKAAGLPIEAHLAIYEPERFIQRFAEAGASYIAVHREAMEDPLTVFRQIRNCQATPVLAYKSTTPPGDDFIQLAREVPWILKLTVNPGFSGQTIQPQAIEHIRTMHQLLADAGLNTKIQADGNININTIPQVVQAGARILTGGSSGLFLNGKSIRECSNAMLRAAVQSLHG
ncbi:MAG: ribulose-phosphate 3-epimerase [Clostridiales bacterium]|nr:ribulose-phosphate 3-epimerase [Clostridiales bacterium]